MNFTPEELKNIGALILKAPITGQESTVVALLLQKIQTMLEPKPEPQKEEKK